MTGWAVVTTRRQEHTEETRRALLDAARALFGTHGFADTSLDDVARGARVTKGALYHHYEGKRQLFEAVLEQLEGEQTAKILAVGSGRGSPWELALRGLDTSLDAFLDPAYRRIVLQDGPTVLGFARWVQLEERYSLGLVRGVLDALIANGTLRPQPPDLLARMVLAAETQAALAIADADDPAVVRRQAGALLHDLLAGLRADGTDGGADATGAGGAATADGG